MFHQEDMAAISGSLEHWLGTAQELLSLIYVACEVVNPLLIASAIWLGAHWEMVCLTYYFETGMGNDAGNGFCFCLGSCRLMWSMGLRGV